MNSLKRNDWLEHHVSEDEEEADLDHNANEESRGRIFVPKRTKRRRISSTEGSDRNLSPRSFDSMSQENTSHVGDNLPDLSEIEPVNQPEDGSNASLHNLHLLSQTTHSPQRLEPSSQGQASSKTGVIYLSRTPPFMTPHTLKRLLSPFGQIGRIFLTPEDPTAHTRRVKAGGNKKRSFTDGWVEFLRKKDAKAVAETLNTQIIGGKKGNWYHDDVWNIKYLKGFKWHHLTEQIANENAERASRLRSEIAHTTRENMQFIQHVEKAKMLEGMEAKRLLKRKGLSIGGGKATEEIQNDSNSVESKEFRRYFRQNESRNKQTHQGATSQPTEVGKVLTRIF